MARERPSVPQIIKRATGDRRPFPSDLEKLASGEERRIRPPPRPRQPRLDDQRAGALIPGVANRDARSAFEQRVRRLRSLAGCKAGDAAAEEELGTQLAQANRLGIWRGGSMTGFDVFVEHAVGLDPVRARALAAAAAAQEGEPLRSLSEEAVAVWLRAECALADAAVEGRVHARRIGHEELLRIEVPAVHAPVALAAVSRRLGQILMPPEETRRPPT